MVKLVTKNVKGLTFLLICFYSVSSIIGQNKEIIGYYPSWRWSTRDNLVNQKTLPYDKLTIINYAFFYPLTDGKIVGMDTISHDNILKGEYDHIFGGYKPNTSLIDIAHSKGVKVLLAVGGWEDSDNFPEVAAHKGKRANFAHWCVKYIKEYGFDGMDIDWEYPGYEPHQGTPQDKQNFTLLLQTVRDSLDTYSSKTGKNYLLTAALPAGKSHTVNIEVENIADILDQLNIMTYDFFGAWDTLSNHNSPLYAPRQGDSTLNVDAAFNLYNKTYGVPANKINLGVAFYGKSFKNCTKLHAAHSGGAALPFSEEEEGPVYYNILKYMDDFTRYWDDQAKVPYLISSKWNTFVSYDDEESIGYKARYIWDNDACGLIIWEITGDYLENGETPLLNVIYSKFYGLKDQDLKK